ncbi:MAG: cyclic nucleotide-binding domain-containing protein [Xanthomonadaceae bacterium]|nr:cyclic nucleotide-binding domain-containing protein [Xanthomonadaceae bacterium]
MTEIQAPTVETIKEVKLLSGFTDEEIQELISTGETYAVQAHTNIMIEGDTKGGMFVLLDGQVGVSKANPMGSNQYDLGHLQPGAVFGELSLIDNNPRSATVRALMDCQVFQISREKFEAYVMSDDSRKMRFYKSCIDTMIARLRETDQKYVISQYQLWKTALARRKEAA